MAFVKYCISSIIYALDYAAPWLHWNEEQKWTNNPTSNAISLHYTLLYSYTLHTHTHTHSSSLYRQTYVCSNEQQVYALSQCMHASKLLLQLAQGRCLTHGASPLHIASCVVFQQQDTWKTTNSHKRSLAFCFRNSSHLPHPTLQIRNVTQRNSHSNRLLCIGNRFRSN